MIKVSDHDFRFYNFTELDEGVLQLVLSWRNHSSVRKWMYNRNIITLEEHLNFVKSLSSRNDKIYYLVERDGIYLGVFSLIDFDGNIGEWGYYLAPEFHHHGLGVEFYYSVLKFCFDTLGIKKMLGYALVDNKSANSLNFLFGFKGEQFKKSDSEELFYKLELSENVWREEICDNKKIHKLLAITRKK